MVATKNTAFRSTPIRASQSASVYSTAGFLLLKPAWLQRISIFPILLIASWTILSIDEIIASKSIKVAGNKFDEDIVKYVKKKYNLLIGDRTAEKIKKDLATAIPESNPEKMDIKGRDLESGIPNTIQINANEIYEAIEDSLYQIVNSSKEVLEKCPPELAADILDNGIVMTGGGSLIRNFIEMMEKEIGIKVYLAENPLDSVVLGGGLAFDNKKLLKTLQMREN